MRFLYILTMTTGNRKAIDSHGLTSTSTWHVQFAISLNSISYSQMCQTGLSVFKIGNFSVERLKLRIF